MAAPFFLLPIGFVAGLAAGWTVSRLAENPPEAGTRTTRSRTIESRTARIRRLYAAIEPIASGASHPSEVFGLSEIEEIQRTFSDETVPLQEVMDYALGTIVALSGAAFSALRRRSDGPQVAARIAERLESLSAWQVQYALEYLGGIESGIAAGEPLLSYQSWWSDNSLIIHAFSDYLDQLSSRGVAAELGRKVQGLPLSDQEALRQFLSRFRHPMAADLAAGLERSPAPAADTSSSTAGATVSFGRFWTDEELADKPIEPSGWGQDLADALKAMERRPIRSLLVSGDALVGKTSFLRILAGRLKPDGWRIFEASGADLQAGQQYIGQLEGRIRQALDELAVSKKVIWYVPDLLALALSGTHQGQSASILDQILPAIAAGRILIWAEASPASAARILQLRPALRRSLEVVRLEPLDVAETTAIAKSVAKRLEADAKVELDESFVVAAIEAARHYLTASSLPGAALALMRMAALRSEKAKDNKLAEHDILDTLAQLTGLPLSILDGSEKINLAEITEFFSRRVIGQTEAVSSIVERIAMLKSGLNDPMKPFGVFLFSGPTGTGKTELAKAIAEYLFGSVDRMIRLDMSEYQAPDSVMKITGGPGMPPEADTLIAKIRKQPFSLILLDEFEKSSPLVWGVFLQVFDEGRLTDAFGQTADFRHCLIILTTNLGATTHQSSGLGFAPAQAVYANDQVLRAIGQTFRPEFQNRLDKIIVFKPLTREHMRGILKKELGRLFDRRGLKYRSWAVEWEASAHEFLLEKGFSPDMGARPLKRAIDQYVVAPLAAAIVERRAPEGEQFVFVRSDGKELQAEFVDPDGDGEATPLHGAPPPPAPAAPDQPPTLASIMLSPRGSAAEIDVLAEAQAGIASRLGSVDWGALKTGLSDAINAPGFWSRDDRHHALARFELMDRVSVAAGAAESLQLRLSKRRGRPGKAARDLVGHLAMQAYLVGEGLKDIEEDAPVEVALAVEAALEGKPAERKASEAWSREVIEMYRGWCRKRGLQMTECDALEEGGLPLVLVAGFGAHRILGREVGLHVLEAGEGASGPSRVAARVLIVSAPLGDLSKIKRQATLAQAFTKAPRPATVVRRYRRQPSPLVRNADGSWRTGKLDAVLAGDFYVIARENL